MDEGLSDTHSPVKRAVVGDDDDDDDFFMPSTGRVRNRGMILDDENSLGEWKQGVCLIDTNNNKFLNFFSTLSYADTGSLRLGRDKFGEDDDAGSTVVPAAAPPLPSQPVYEGPLPTPPQKAFQPSSTPMHLTHRFMVQHPPKNLLNCLKTSCRLYVVDLQSTIGEKKVFFYYSCSSG